MSITVLSPAKLNLSLNVVGRRADGYHLLDTVMQTVNVYDRITVDYAPAGIQLTCDGNVPMDMRCTAYQAAVRFQEATGYTGGFAVTVEKHIPFEAGLAGGSADAAGVLHALNRLTGAGLSVEKLCEIGSAIGADVPFCVHGGTVLCTDIGTVLTPLAPLPPCYIVVAKPEGGVSTPEAYRLLDTAPSLCSVDVAAQCAAMSRGDLTGVAAQVGNAFEAALNLPYTAPIRQVMADCGALAGALSGSGSAVFGLFDREEQATRCATALQGDYPFVTVCTPCDGVKFD